MKFKPYAAVILTLCVLFSASSYSETKKDTLESPSAYLPEREYEFGPVLEGTRITHYFVMQNKGSVPLKIARVKTGWGCTAVSYPKQILPGGEGKFVIKVNTSGYGGRRLRKKILVQTDDTKHPFVSFTIMGDIEAFVHLKPKKVYLRGVVGTDIKKTVSIIPAEKYPFKILGAGALNGRDISYKLEKDKNSKMKGYLLTIVNRRKEKGPYFDTINLKTDSKIRPIIKVRVYGNIINPRKKDVE